MFTTIDEGLTFLKNKDLDEINLENEISLEIISSKNDNLSILSIIEECLIKEINIPKVLLLKGAAGSGKTFFCQKLTLYLWEKYEKDSKYIPLYMKASNLINSSNKIIKKTLENIGFAQDHIEVLKEQYHFIFIFDGYDELYEFNNLHLNNNLSEWRAQTIISCRNEALFFVPDHEKYFMPFKAGKRLASELYQFEIKPLSFCSIESFLISYEKHNFSGLTYENLKTIPGLLYLIQTPLLLKSILRIKGYSLNVPQDFYDSIVEARFLWQEQKLKLQKLIDRSIDLKPYFWAYCKNIASIMKEKGLDCIIYKKSKSYLFKNTAEDNSLWEKFFKKDGSKIQWSYFSCPLKKNEQGKVSFIDDCLVDYFVSSTRYSEDIELFQEFQKISSPTQKEKHKHQLFQLPIIGRRLFTDQIEKVQQLADRVVKSNLLKASLFNYIELSKTDQRYEVAASNSITALNYAKISFSGMDFRRICIAKANLSQGVFDSTNFDNSNLMQVNFRSAWLSNATFKGSLMLGVELGELPFLQLFKPISYVCYSERYAYSEEKFSFLAVASDCSIKLYKDIDLTEVKSFIGHTSKVNCVAFSANAEWLVSGSEDNFIRLWEVSTGECRQIYEGHSESVNDINLNTNMEYLASGSSDRSVRVWSVFTGKCEGVYLGHTDKVSCVCFTPNGQYILSGSWDSTIRVWNILKGECEKIMNEHKAPVCSVKFSPTSEYFVSGSWDQKIFLWNFTTGQCEKIYTGHTSHVSTVSFSPNGEYIASGSWDQSVRIWSVLTGECKKIYNGHTNWVYCVNFSFNGKNIVSGGLDGSIRLWNVNLNEIQNNNNFGHSSPVYSICFNSNGEYIASGSYDKTVLIWDSLTGECKKIYKSNDDVSSICYSPDGKYVAFIGQSSKGINFSRTTNMGYKLICERDEQISSICFNPKGNHIAFSCDNQVIFLWNYFTESYEQKYIGHTNFISSMCFSSEGNYLASGSWDHTVRLWDTISGECKKIYIGHANYVSNVCFSHNDKYLASAGFDNIIFIWNTLTCEILKIYVQHSNVVSSICFNPSGDYLVSGSWDQTIKIWSINSSENNAIISYCVDSLIYSVVWKNSLDSIDYIAVGQENNLVSVWKPIFNTDYNYLKLIWNSHQNLLCAFNADLDEAKELSTSNATLLRQRGAIDNLYTYSKEGHIFKLINLLKNDVNVNVKYKNGITALLLASYNGHFEVVKHLIEHQADVNVVDFNGVSALLSAAQNDHVSVVDKLIDSGADVSHVSNNGISVFSSCIRSKDQKLLQIIIYKKIIEIHALLFPDNQQLKEILIKIVRKKVNFGNIIDFILKNKGNINVTQKDGVTLLMMACSINDYKSAEKLINAGAEKDSLDSNYISAIHYACVGNKIKLLVYLLKQGCSLENVDGDGNYLEIWAVKEDNLESLQAIINFKGNDKIRDIISRSQGEGKNLIEYAKKYKASKCLTYFSNNSLLNPGDSNLLFFKNKLDQTDKKLLQPKEETYDNSSQSHSKHSQHPAI